MLHHGGTSLVVRGCLVQRVLARELERVGSNTCCNILKQGEIIKTYVYNHRNICNI